MCPYVSDVGIAQVADGRLTLWEGLVLLDFRDVMGGES